jgi:PAS domain S-box-containing protein
VDSPDTPPRQQRLASPPADNPDQPLTSGEPAVSGLEQLSAFAAGQVGGAGGDTANILTLLADSLQVGATCVARVLDGIWRIDQVCDRAGMGLPAGGPLPYSDVFGPALSDVSMPSRIVEDVRTDVRCPRRFTRSGSPVGAITAVPLNWADGRSYGALCTFHPRKRAVPGGEIPVLRLAGRMVMRAMEATITRERERQWAEQLARFAAIVAASDNAIVSADETGRIATWNPGAEALFGYSAEEATGQSLALLLPPEHHAGIPAQVQRIRAGEHVARHHTVGRWKDGSLFDLALTLSPILDERGVVIGLSGIGDDITAKVLAQRESERAQRAAEELETSALTARLGSGSQGIPGP